MIKFLRFVLVAVLFSVGASAAPTPAAVKASKRSAKVFKGPEGEKVTFVYLEPSETGDVLIRFDDVDGEWNGKVLIHKRLVLRDWGDPKEDFSTTVDGHPYVTAWIRGYRTDQNGQKYPDMTVGAKGGRADFHVRYSEADSKAAAPLAIIKQFQRESGIYGSDGGLKKADAEKAQKANALAIQLYAAGKKEEAIVAWQRLLEVDPLNDHARENIRTALAELAVRQ